VADDVVRLPDELAFGKAADLDEIAIDRRDDAALVGARNDDGAFGKRNFLGGYREVLAHWVPSLHMVITRNGMCATAGIVTSWTADER
jgi:hypothetical protein